ncbi:hypothetical protein J4208_03890 [Candidatus Woesearchaeota archaeon]|nr:hypothetical protein [Candidatus Woesearchaeota archaeon]
MSFLTKIKALDYVTKIGLILVVMVGCYLLFIWILSPVLIKTNIPAHGVRMGDHIMTFSNQEQIVLNLVATLLAIIISIAAWLLMKGNSLKQENEVEIMKRALSPDEKKMVEEVQKAGEITQDSLRFRLDWSKAKVSAILLQLDRMNLVQRERQGKTYNVFIKKK